ncbi:YfjI family protein [Hydrogenophaga taeniospiralis]|uniref:YfjI family protein n=1 Tax=Hydrogenophaga taeniospiralis TaxID=65656 RepID=UPI001CFB8CEB|nr:YfjI family protein [Hydrogenophaga taeniospiralis]UCU95203.1 DUF3987 domain-containing protein [Hydrogenophaga taeniospiralis]
MKQRPFLNNPSNYPIDSLPTILHDALVDLTFNIQAPIPLSAITLLTAISVASQKRIKVKLPIGGMPRSVCLYLLAIAESGSRKSVLDSQVSAIFYRRDEAAEVAHANDMASFSAEYDVWSEINRALVGEIARQARKGEGDVNESLYSKLSAHRKREPIKPRLRRLMRQDATERAIIDALQGTGESIALIVDEGEVLLRSALLSKTGVLNKIWDGGTVTLDRANDVSITARQPKMTVSILVQNEVLQDYIAKRGASVRGSGFWARFLVTYPPSTQGTRFSVPEGERTEDGLKRFQERIEQMINDEGEEPLVYEFDAYAKQYWFNMVDMIESMIQPWGYLNDISDYASKAGEITARIAALLHHFGEQQGQISVETLMRAQKIMYFHLDEFKKIFAPPAPVPQFQIDADSLRHYLQTNFWSRGQWAVPRNLVLRCGPVRPKSRFVAALDHLCINGVLWIGRDQKGAANIYYGTQAQYHQGLSPSLPLPA